MVFVCVVGVYVIQVLALFHQVSVLEVLRQVFDLDEFFGEPPVGEVDVDDYTDQNQNDREQQDCNEDDDHFVFLVSHAVQRFHHAQLHTLGSFELVHVAIDCGGYRRELDLFFAALDRLYSVEG